MSKTKLLIVSGRLGVGGAERFVSNLLTFLSMEKFDLHLCLGQNCIEYPVPGQVSVTHLNYSNILRMPETILRLRWVIKTWKPDVVLSTIGLANRWTGMALLGIGTDRPKWVARIGNNLKHGGRSEWRNSLNLMWDKYTYKNTDQFVVNSRGLKEQFREIYPHAKGRLDVHYNPTDFEEIASQSAQPTQFSKPPDKIVLMHAGRFHRQKRHDILIEAFQQLLEKHNFSTRLELWLCGDGYLRKEIEEDIFQRGLQDSVRILGHITSPYSVFRHADLFLLSSDWEGMPNVLIEAMGLGIPVLSTNCPFGPAELIDDGVSGFLCPVSDAVAYSDAMFNALTSPNLLETANSGRLKVMKLFDYKVNMQKWQKILMK